MDSERKVNTLWFVFGKKQHRGELVTKSVYEVDVVDGRIDT